ncbi:MAG: undecaprenyl-phosphate glucose phosphotransferase [Parvibaculum sp.]|uniref:undecaprenyl-phosphate glucose phosphotransferase n=1 Tax=Parvibaculum sp. TaxID=2024848 RepID=UPI0028420108|nr:undecaprenyl-phosphate glucose phosphotransferase [Parvibaculum sp.]MDR3499417.1 undecaprenyl-phosphate glucose phosphotransferase [Parvibaculum sp.]
MISDTVAVIDFCIVALMSIVAEWAYLAAYLDANYSYEPYIVAGALGGLVIVSALRNQGAYSFERLVTFRGQSRRILLALAMAVLVLLSVGYMLKQSAFYSRGWMITWFALAFASLFVNHYLASRILRRWSSFGLFARNIAIYGSGEVAAKLIEHLSLNAELTRIHGVFDDLLRGMTPRVVVAGGLSDLIRVGQSTRLDEVLIALPLSEEGRIASLLTNLSVLPIDIRLCPDIAAFELRPVGVVNYDGVAVLELARRPLDDWGPIVKAVEDRALASLMLLVALPLMLIVSLAIKLDSKGPVFFRQRRHGFNHHVISVWKFRTMRVSEDGIHVPQATRDDPRVTRVGRLLRRTSIDELPQLFNVIRGDMSLVGPRPHAIAHNEHYSALLERYASRHKVKPGITGWAQVNGYRGETDTPEKMRKRVEHDLYYIENWSLWLDVKILLLTPVFGLFGRNAF